MEVADDPAPPQWLFPPDALLEATNGWREGIQGVILWPPSRSTRKKP